MEDIAAKICYADSPAVATSLYTSALPSFKNWRFILGSDKGITTGAAVNRSFQNGAAVKSLFAADHVFVLDEYTSQQMAFGKATVSFDFSISLDTNAFSYIRSYLKNQVNIAKSDVDEFVKFIARDNVNVDPAPYLMENQDIFQNGSDEQKALIFDNICAYEVIRTIDKHHFHSTNEIKSTLSDDEIKSKAAYSISASIYKSSDDILNLGLKKVRLCLHCLLLKMVIINFFEKGDLVKKIEKFMDFMDTKLGAMFDRESVIAFEYFRTGQNLRFFGRIQKNNPKILKEIRNMAWDLFHVRITELGFVFKGQEGARYFFPAILTFDKNLIEIINLRPLRAIILSPENALQPIYNVNVFDKISQNSDEASRRLLHKFYSDGARNRRHERINVQKLNEIEKINILVNEMESKLASTLD